MNFPRELYKGKVYAVVHSQEEHDRMTGQGWGTERNPDGYIPVSAAKPADYKDATEPDKEADDAPRGKVCGNCGEPGHNARTCTVK